MGTLAPLIGTFGFLALLIGLLMFIPVPALKARRALAQKLAIGGGVAFIVALILDPNPPSANPTAKSVATPASSEPSPTPSPRSAPQGQAAFLAGYRSLLAATKPCDRAIATVGEAASGARRSGSMLELYSAAKAGQEACEATFIAIGNMEPADDLTEAASDASTKAIDTCKSAYFLRQRAMETAMKIADGDTRASNVVSFQDDLKLGQSGVMACVTQWFVAGQAAGVPMDKMK